MTRHAPAGIVPRRQPWVTNRFTRKNRGASRAVLLAIPASLLLWATAFVLIAH